LAQQPGPKDAMHVWLEGLTKSELCYTMYMMARTHGWCTPEELKARTKAFKWPRDKPTARPGFIPNKVFTGTASKKAAAPPAAARGQGRGGRATTAAAPAAAPTAARGRGRAPATAPPAPRGPTAAARDPAETAAAAAAAAASAALPHPHSTVTMPYTAHHMLLFVLNSIEVFRPLLPPNAMEYAFWRSWVQHVHIIAMIMKPTFTYPELVKLDNLVFQWHTTFFEVPEYQSFWVPKFHFACHLAHDILRFGPPRLTWCMMYEAKNQPLKKGCKLSNFHNPPKATSKFWCESSDHFMRKPKKSPPCEPKPLASGVAADFPQFSEEITFMLSNVPHAGRDEDVCFSFLATTKQSQVTFYSSSYALVKTSGKPQTLCYIKYIIAIAGHVYVWVNLYPPALMVTDTFGVMTASLSAMHTSAPNMMFLSLSTAEISALWHFPQPSGIATFISKW
jgi:hypothetical protein